MPSLHPPCSMPKHTERPPQTVLHRAHRGHDFRPGGRSHTLNLLSPLLNNLHRNPDIDAGNASSANLRWLQSTMATINARSGKASAAIVSGVRVAN